MSRLSRMKLGGIFAGSAVQFVFWEGSQERSKKALDYVSVKSRQGLLWKKSYFYVGFPSPLAQGLPGT